MPAEQLAAGYLAYVSTDEVSDEAATPEDATVREPTTSIATTVCIISAHCAEDEA
jgi:hypothetical protein